MAETPLQYAGTRSTFNGSLQPLSRGSYTLEIIASDPANANFATYRQKLEVR